MRSALCIALLAALAVTSFAPSDAHADEPAVVEVSAAVRDLNEKAVNKVVLGEYDDAVKLLEASLQLQALNITYLNLGRVYQYQGECELARKAWAQALEADRVPEPTHQQIVATLFEYRKELDASCKEDTGDAVATDLPTPDPEPEPEPEPQPTPEPIAEPEPVPPSDGGSSYSPWSWIALGTGAALVVSAVAIDAAVIGPKFDDLDAARDAGDRETFDTLDDEIGTLQGVNIALISVGGVAMATGAVLLILDLTSGGGDDGVSVAPTVGPDGMGANVSVRF